MTSQTLSLNLIPKGISPRLYVSQYDKGQEWNFEIYAGAEVYTIPSESSVTIQGTKPDKTGFQYACSFSGNRVTATEQQQMTILAGEVPAEIRIEKNNEIIATLNFIIVVEKAALADDTVISETELPLIEEAIEVLGHADELVNQIQGYATTAQNAASTATTKASQASTSATNASNSATTASNAATTATNKASEATTAASTATTKASQASTSATSAAGSASTATTKAQEAAASAAAAAQSAAHLTIDGEMSTTSENALQNKVVTSAIQNLSNQVNDIYEVMGEMSAKNLVNISDDNVVTLSGFTKVSPNHYAFTSNGHTLSFVINADKSVTLSCDGDTGVSGAAYIDFAVNLKSGTKYTTNGITGGSLETYQFFFQRASGYASSAGYLLTGETTWTQDNDLNAVVILRIRSFAKSSFSVTLYPMIRDAKDTDPTYEPYAKTNQQLTQETTGLIDNTKANGAVNSLGITKAELHSINTVGSWSGETYTESGATFACEYDDAGYLKKVTVNKSSGTESNSSLYLKLKPEFPYLPIKLIGCPSGGGTNWDDRKYYLYYANWSNTTGLVADYGNGGIITSQFDYSTYANARLSLQIKSGQAANNLVFYPMLIPPTMQGISNVNPVPYAKSNKELTEEVEEADHYVSGESFGGSNGTIILIGCSNAAGTSIYLQIPLPKNVLKAVSVPSAKYNIPINWVRANGQSITSGLTVDSVTLLRPGMLGLTVSGTFSAMTLYAVSLGSWTVIVP